jgi:hypothetical protein
MPTFKSLVLLDTVPTGFPKPYQLSQNLSMDFPFAAMTRPCYIEPCGSFVMEKIGLLKKVTLSMEAGTSPELMDLTPRPSQLEFIYGLGTEGLTPFEFQLVDKTVGNEVRLQISGEQIPRVFQHLSLPSINIPETLNTIFFKFIVLEILHTNQREVIKALAENANCGDSCCCH